MKDPDWMEDPILQGNDVPDVLKATWVQVEGTNATVYLEYVGFVSDCPLLEVRLEKQNGKWLINELLNRPKDAK